MAREPLRVILGMRAWKRRPLALAQFYGIGREEKQFACDSHVTLPLAVISEKNFLSVNAQTQY
jgi:hypothetical protein